MANIDQDDAHGRLIGILTEALRKAGAEGITKQDVIPAVADFWTPIALIMAGEAGVCAVMTRMESRIEDWTAGRFPAPDPDEALTLYRPVAPALFRSWAQLMGFCRARDRLAFIEASFEI